MPFYKTGIADLYLLEFNVIEDDRGSFTVPFNSYAGNQLAQDLSFVPSQQNVAVSKRGVIRGIHADPWDKWITVAQGRVHAAIVDLRDVSTYGQVYQRVIEPGWGLFVPKGCGNSYQALADDTVYLYLVNGQWQPNTVYPAIAFDDPDLGINWPITGAEQIVSDKDRGNPRFQEANPELFDRWLGIKPLKVRSE